MNKNTIPDVIVICIGASVFLFLYHISIQHGCHITFYKLSDACRLASKPHHPLLRCDSNFDGYMPLHHTLHIVTRSSVESSTVLLSQQ